MACHIPSGCRTTRLCCVTGKRCAGAWTEWGECDVYCNQTRTYIVPGSSAHGNGNGSSSSSGGTRRLLGNNGQGSSGLKPAKDKEPGGNSQHPPEGQNQQGRPDGSGQSHGLAAAISALHSQSQGLALALGRIDCSAINNTMEVRTCTTGTCAGFCRGTPNVVADLIAWGCTNGTQNGSTCTGTCATGGSRAITRDPAAQAECIEGLYSWNGLESGVESRCQP